MISSLLHLVGLRPRVYYTLTNFRGGGARPPWPPLLNTPMLHCTLHCTALHYTLYTIHYTLCSVTTQSFCCVAAEVCLLYLEDITSFIIRRLGDNWRGFMALISLDSVTFSNTPVTLNRNVPLLQVSNGLL